MGVADAGTIGLCANRAVRAGRYRYRRLLEGWRRLACGLVVISAVRWFSSTKWHSHGAWTRNSCQVAFGLGRKATDCWDWVCSWLVAVSMRASMSLCRRLWWRIASALVAMWTILRRLRTSSAGY